MLYVKMGLYTLRSLSLSHIVDWEFTEVLYIIKIKVEETETYLYGIK